MATHSSTLTWKIPWREEPGRLQSMGSQRVGHDCMTPLSLFTFTFKNPFTELFVKRWLSLKRALNCQSSNYKSSQHIGKKALTLK